MAEAAAALEGRITFLNVGTKMLLKDTMDQFVRTQGDFKTHYAPSMASALRAFADNTIHVVITEVDLGDGSAYRLIQNLGGPGGDDLYVILALEERSPQLLALAEELEANSVLIKPFAAADLKNQLERYRAWRTLPKEPWAVLVRDAKQAAREKKFREAETHYKEAITAAPSLPTPLLRAAQYYVSKPDYGIAEQLLRKAIDIKGDYIQAIGLLGSIFLAKRDIEKADQFLRQANQLSPLNPDRHVEMFKLSLERCVDACRSSLKIDPGAITARFNLGKVLALQKDYVGAVRELEQVVPALKDATKAEAQTFIALSRKLGGLAK